MALLKGSLAGVLAAGAGAGAQVVVVLVVTRAFPPQVAGAFFTAMALCLMATGILRLDAGNGLIHTITRALDRHPGPAVPPHTHDDRHNDPENAPTAIVSGHTRMATVSESALTTIVSGHVRAAVLPVATLSLAAATAVHLYADRIAALTGVPGPWLRMLAFALPVMACADLLVSATRGLGVMRPTALLTGLLQPVAQLTLVTCAAYAGVSALLPAAWALPYAVVLGFAALWLHRHRTPAPATSRTSPAEPTSRTGQATPGAWRELWSHTAPRSIGGALQAVFQRLDIVIVAVLAGPVEAAFYTAATRFKVIGQLAGLGLAQAAQPRLVRALARTDRRHARELYQITTLWLVAATWPIWIAYAALAPWLLPLFGDGYARAAPVAVVVAVTMMAASACGMADVVLTAAGHTALSLANITAAVTVTVALDLALIPAHGALGAALGWSAGVLVKNLLPLAQIHRAYGLRPFGRHTRTALGTRSLELA